MVRRFHDLGQHAAHVLRVDEEHRRSVRPNARLAQYPRALRFKRRLGGVNVGPRAYRWNPVEPATVLTQAREAAQGKDVRVGGGVNVIQQYLNLGVVEELEIAPAVRGLFDGLRTPREVVEHVYTDVDPVLWGAAELSVRAQLEYLRG